MEAIDEGSNISRTECGHTFHFPCLYRWNREHTNCPLCRREFGTFEEEKVQSTYSEWVTTNVWPLSGIGQFLMNSSTGGYGRTSVLDTMDRTLRTQIRGSIERVNSQRPIEEFTGEIDSRDIDLVLQHTINITRETAEAYLRHYGGDIVEAILCLAYDKDMPIPPFRPRERPELPEPYVVRQTHDRTRIVRRTSVDFGYDSS